MQSIDRSYFRWYVILLLSVLLFFNGCVCEDTSASEENELCVPDCSEKCGKNANITESSGFLTNRWEFPWSVAIFRIALVAGRTKNIFLCGGTLVGRDAVLTTAECVLHETTASLRVYVGQWDLAERIEGSEEILEVEKKVIHPCYKLLSKQHNLALLILDDNVQLRPSVNRVCIAEAEQQYEHDHHCYTVGWGTEFINGTNQLRKLKVRLIPHNDCQKSLRAFLRLREYELVPEAVCAVADDDIELSVKDYPCSRIIGSGLVCTEGSRTDQFYLVGVGSDLSRNCSHRNVPPDLFMDVRKYTGWIDNELTRR
ncbi:phenoloxidase-activating factor 2-like [Anopheles darlingi]|uniref:phenoloxidase-activating factor 2-like n=1 Tax=Anopheles darlingi TaxID=43151 RepID=UPI0020FFFDE9|nr:phenoloxidase-activating factor 2-like [Anopheles darlingi]